MKIETKENKIHLSLTEAEWRRREGGAARAFIHELKKAIPPTDRVYIGQEKKWIITETEDYWMLINDMYKWNFQ